MLRSRSCRLSVAIVAATASVGGAVMAGSAASAAPAILSIRCSILTGTVTGLVTLTGCSGDTGGSSRPFAATALGLGIKVLWRNSKTTTLHKPTITRGGSACPAGSSETIFNGKVTGDTTHSVTVGSAYVIRVCDDAFGNLSLAPHTKAVI